jgi:hypothetical protein
MTKSIFDQLEPGVIYLTDGTLQSISWLVKNLPTRYLHCPTTKELLTELEEDRDEEGVLVITPYYLQTTKQNNTYGLPVESNIFICSYLYVFIALDSSPQIIELEDTEKVKALKKNLDTSLNGFNYKRFSINFKLSDLKTDKDIQQYLNLGDLELEKIILKEYKDYPYTLLKFLKAPELFKLLDVQEDVDENIINCLGTIEGVDKWSNLNNQDLQAIFIVKTIVDNLAIPYIVKSLCTFKNFKQKYNTLFGQKEIPINLNLELYLALKPILKKISKVNLVQAKLYLSYFSRFALAMNRAISDEYSKSFCIRLSKQKKKYLSINLKEEKFQFWLKYIARI